MGRWDSLALDGNPSRSESPKSILALQVRGLGLRLTPSSRKKIYVTETMNTEIEMNQPGDNRMVRNDCMKMWGQSRQEARRPTSSMVSPKHVLNVGNWNVRTMYRGGAAAQIAREMEGYQLDVLGISECRWVGAGKQRITSGQTIIYSGNEESHEGGVAIMINKETEKALMEWTPVSPRIITARFYSKYRKVSIIQVYAPHNEREEDEKDEFYQELQDTYDKCNHNDIVLVMGDLNAKVGDDNTGYEQTMGKHGLGMRNENGVRLCEFCSTNGLIITGTLFPHKDIHKATWVSADNKTKNQIDHLMISGKWRTSVRDTRSQRGADANSDHYLVKTKIKLRLNINKNNKKIKPRLNVERLNNNETRKEYKETVRKKIRLFRKESDTHNVEGIWEQQRKAYIESAEGILGYKKGKSKPWISGNTWNRIDRRKEIKKKIDSTKSERIKERLKEEYKQEDKEVKRSVREDKRNWAADKAQQAQRAAENGRQKELYNIVKQLTGQNSRKTATIKNKDGELLKRKEERLERWKEHFQEILNREQPQEPPHDEEIAQDEIDIPTEAPTKQEIKKAVQTMRNGKAPGIDQITAEMIKADIEGTCEELELLFKQIWREEKIPEQWKKGLIYKIPKKGNMQECGNWRGVTLLPITSKVLGKILIKRIQDGIDQRLRKEQAGFRPGRNTVEQIFILRNILEQANEWNTTLYIHFVDFEKAFDSIHRDSLWIIMKKYGIPKKIVTMVQAMYDGSQCAVIEESETTEWFPVITGVKQGCCMSGFLFLLAIDWVMRKTVEGTRTGIRWNFMSQLEDLDFADDIALLSSTLESLQQKTTRLEENSQRIGLKLNAQKCKVMKVNSKKEGRILVGQKEIEDVGWFQYLGACMTQDGGSTVDIKRRIALANTAFRKISRIMNANDIGRKTKITLFQTLVLSVLLYGCETWKLTKGEEKQLDTFQNKHLRRILGIRWQQRVRNERILEIADTERISKEVRRRRWTWLGHVMRKDPRNDCAVALEWTPEGRRRKGRPKITWRRMMERERDKAGWPTWGRTREMAKDRQQWKSCVQALCASWHEEN